MISASESKYPSCCISGTGKYWLSYDNCAFGKNTFPCCAYNVAKFWDRQKDACCITADTASCCGYGMAQRACTIVQVVGDVFYCLSTCLPVGMTTPVIAGGAGCIAACLWCGESCYTAEKQTAAHASTKKVCNFAVRCCGNGSFYTAAVCLAGTKAMACCIPNLTCPEILNMWCWQQETNVLLHEMASFKNFHERVCCEPTLNPVEEVAEPASPAL